MAGVLSGGEKVSSTTLIAMSVIFFLINLFGGSSLKYFVWYLRTLQIIIHLPFMTTQIPANVSAFFEMLVPIVTFDLLSSSRTTEKIMVFDYETQRNYETSIQDNTRDIGYSTHNSIMLLGSLWLYSLFFFFLVIVYFIMRVVPCKSEIYKKMKDFL